MDASMPSDEEELHVQYTEDLSKAAEREAALAAHLARKDSAAAGSAMALTAAQKKHEAAVKALRTSHNAAVKKMQARPSTISRCT